MQFTRNMLSDSRRKTNEKALLTGEKVKKKIARESRTAQKEYERAEKNSIRGTFSCAVPP